MTHSIDFFFNLIFFSLLYFAYACIPSSQKKLKLKLCIKGDCNLSPIKRKYQSHYTYTGQENVQQDDMSVPSEKQFALTSDLKDTATQNIKKMCKKKEKDLEGCAIVIFHI